MEICPHCKKSLKPSPVSILTFQSIVDYLNQKTGRSFKATTPATRRLIKARINEGFTEQDFLSVIDNMCNKWLSDDQMLDYLRPQTLFGTKFESYLQNGQKPQARPQPKIINHFNNMIRAYDILSKIHPGDLSKFESYCNQVKLPSKEREMALNKFNGFVPEDISSKSKEFLQAAFRGAK